MHVAIKRIGLPDELSSLWRVGDAIEKLSFTHIFFKGIPSIADRHFNNVVLCSS
jgi:hypothetical protein